MFFYLYCKVLIGFNLLVLLVGNKLNIILINVEKIKLFIVMLSDIEGVILFCVLVINIVFLQVSNNLINLFKIVKIIDLIKN